MNNIEINNCLNKNPLTKKFYCFTIAADELKYIRIVKYPKFIILNTSPSTRRTGHWLALGFINKNLLEIFDSSGFMFRINKYLRDYIKNLPNDVRLEYCAKLIQDPNSDICGIYCIDYVLNRLKNRSLKSYCEQFNANNRVDNDEKVLNNFKKHFSRCITPTKGYFQKCCKLNLC